MMRRENHPKRKAQAARTRVWGNKTRSHLAEGDLAKMGAAIGHPTTGIRIGIRDAGVDRRNFPTVKDKE